MKDLRLALFLLILLIGCGTPTDEVVRAEFLRENPRTTVSEVYVGEGDSDTAYFTIKFKRDSISCRACWAYSDYPNNKEWKVVSRAEVPEPAREGFCQ